MTGKKTTKNVKHKALEVHFGGSRTLDRLQPGLAIWDPSVSLAHWAAVYMDKEVIGIQALNTIAAKKRDLISFMDWFFAQNGHLNAGDWLPRDTKGFVDHLEGEGRAAATVNRALATLRKFARWVHDQEGSPFVAGLPTSGIKDLLVDEPSAKKLESREVNRLFKAADRLVITETRKNASPRRNRAILALLYYSGLRVSELCEVRINQYTGSHLVNVKRKGNARTSKLYLSKDCRTYLDDYIEHERGQGGQTAPLIPVSRLTVWRALERLSGEASKHSNDKIKIHPHRLRHTFGFEVRKRTGSDTETAALLGHAGLKYVGRYVRRTDKEREEILDDL